ncbi:hypothetical protein B484DRAFT_446375 [Ochromonadaceae sp. CCMP2298]|nr:hypothetical protein B484DRAFT_446375 [Ochromonadaceae sp. CCMP2298]
MWLQWSLVFVVALCSRRLASALGEVGGIAQRGELVKDGSVFEYIHIAKCAGRAAKSMHSKKQGSPFAVVHKHRVRAADVEAKNHTAVAVLRDPVERFESAFTFVRTGGFGVRLGPTHNLNAYNSSDSLAAALNSPDPALSHGREALRCDAKLRYCAPAPAAHTEFDPMQHTSIEFRPQSWWLNNLRAASLRIICFDQLEAVLPGVRKVNKAARKTDSLKGYWFVRREVAEEANRAFVRRFYAADEALYDKYCRH